MSTAILAGHLQRFFTDRLLGQLGASPHTVASYRDTFRLLLKFASKHYHRQASDLRMEIWTPSSSPLSSNILSRIATTARARGTTV